MKRELVDQIPAEPDPSDGNVVRIVLKTPNGQRLERRFLRNQSSKVCLHTTQPHTVAEYFWCSLAVHTTLPNAGTRRHVH